MGTVEIRCPNGRSSRDGDGNLIWTQRLFTKLRLSGEKPVYVEGNLIEFSCPECKRIYRQRGENVSRVLHRYNFLGELVETVTETA